MSIKKIVIIMSIFFTLSSCQSQKKKDSTSVKTFNVIKTETEWKSILSSDQFYVLRQKGTERPFTGNYNKHYEKGTYVCAACQTPLYLSDHKFDSGTGWPSFYKAIDKNIYTDVDYDLGYARRELLCNNCGGHLGHVFGDGPKPTGKRHCINSISLQFIPTNE